MANLFDAANAPEGEPTIVTVGDFIQWKRSDLVDDYPPASYTATYVARITGGGSNEIQLTGTDQTTHYLFTVPSADSDYFNPGYYHWQLEIVRNSDLERIVVDTGTFTAQVDLDVNQSDPRTHAEIMVDKIESILEGRADSDVANYSIKDRSLTKLSIDELLRWRDYYRLEFRKEKTAQLIAKGETTGVTVKVRF